MPYFVKAELSGKGIRFFQIIKEGADRKKKAANNQKNQSPGDFFVQRNDNQQRQPSHPHIKGNPDPFRQVMKLRFQPNSQKGQKPDQPQSAPPKSIPQKNQTKRAESPGDHQENGIIVPLAQEMLGPGGSMHPVMKSAGDKKIDQDSPINGKTKRRPQWMSLKGRRE